MMCAELLADGSGTYYEAPPYARTVDADTQDGVPAGVVSSAMFTGSAVYPGVTWNYWVYVPAQYDGSEPAALLVLTDGAVYQDNGGGAAYRTPTVLDNLINEGAMPVTIAVFVDPGVHMGGNSTRSLEYDTPDDAYVTFILDELLPAAVGGYVVTDDPGARAIGGRSSGGAAAFTAGWERPDAFGLVYTTLGSFVQLRANAMGEFSDRYPALIATQDRKPLRVTLLSGINDLDNRYGNWRDAHMAMTTALDCAGYTYRSGFGESGHGDTSHPFDEFGNDLRWLFADAG
jgi:enterochelin esterase-like enzyme